MRPISLNDIYEMFQRGRQKANTHMLVICDRVEDEEYIDFARGNEEVLRKLDQYKEDGVAVVEVYDLSMDMDIQVGASCAMNYARI